MDDRTLGRGAFLGVVGAGLAGLFWGKDATDLLGKLVPNGISALSPSTGWRIYTVAPTMPDIRPADWRLVVEGLGSGRTLTFAELADLPQTEEVRDFHCVTGWSVENVHWRGVRVADLLDELGPPPRTASVRFHSAEIPYEDSLTFAQATLPDVMLATHMEGRPLSRQHGGPVRLVMPRMYGYKSVKWVRRLEFRSDLIPGFWEQRGYDADAWLGRSNGKGNV
jgi:DMSO/TMAO reductase YedYZ molybdopterin-dependent catalytic subunit